MIRFVPRTARRAARRRLAQVTAVALLVSGGFLGSTTAADATNATVSYDNLRTGWDPNESGLAPSSVSATDFGQQFSTAVNGQVYAQPIVGNGVVFIGTENNYIYGLNPAGGAVLWSRNVGPAWPAATLNCGDLVPNIGITATPVYDGTTGTVYFTAKVNNGATAATPHWYLHAVDIKTGVERSGWPVTIGGTPTNSPGNAFNAETAGQRPGLLLLGGVVYIGFASHCDHGPYVGYVAGVNTSTRQTTLFSTEAGSATAEAGVWQSGGGLVSDGPGRIIFSTGNGRGPAPGPGTVVPPGLGESVVRLQVNANGSLSVQDYFSPSNNTGLDTNDTDLGSGGPMAVPDGWGTAAHPHLLVQMGKDGRLFLLDRDNLGGTAQGPGGTNKVVSQAGPYHGLWGHPAFWGGADGGYVYTVENNGPLRAHKITTNSSGTPVLVSSGTSAATFGYTSGSPVITSTGNNAGSALIWVIRTTGPTGANGQLVAYDAVPVNGVLNLRYSASIGTVAKFGVPGTDTNRVFVGTRDGHVLAFGRPAGSSLTGAPINFGSVDVGTTGTATLNLTATRQVTVRSATTGAPFGTSFTGSKTIAQGGTLALPVTFTPTATGAASGTVTVSTDVGIVRFDLNGVGTRTGLGASPPSVNFGTVPTPGVKTLAASIINTGTTPVTVSSSTGPTAPFSADSLPADGTVIPAGGSVAISITYAPTAPGTFSSSVVIGWSDGSVTVPLTGSAISGASKMVLGPNPLSFGAVLMGTSKTSSFAINNKGNINLTITKAKAPAGVFTSDSPVAEGQLIEPGESIDQPVTARPLAAGVATSGYVITGDDGQGVQTENLTAIGARVDNLVGKASARCLDLSNRGLTNGTAVQLFDCNATVAQDWRLGSNSSIQVLGRCLDVSYSGKADGTRVWSWVCNGTGAQRWTITAAGTLVNTNSGKCLTPAAGGTASGVFATIATCNGSAAQVWLSPNRTGPAVGSASGRCLDVRSSLTADGTKVQLYDCNGTAAQSWTMARGGEVRALTKCLDVSASGTAAGTKVQLFSCNGTVAQQWVLQPTGVLVNPHSGKCLGPAGAGTVNTTAMQILNCTGTAEQAWVLS